MIAQHLLVLESAKELQFAELFRLESAGRFQLAAECQEVRRQHGFEDCELLDQYARYLCATPQQPRSLVDLILRLSDCVPAARKFRHYRIQIVQQFFEP